MQALDVGVPVVTRPVFHERMPEVFQQSDGFADRFLAFRIDLGLGGRRGGPRDAEATRLSPDFLQIRSRWRHGMTWRTDVGTAHRVEERRGVPDRPGECKLDRMTADRVGAVRTRWNTVSRGFEADESIAGCGQTDGAAPVITVGNRNNSRRDGSARAAARTPGASCEIPRIVYGTVEHGFRRWTIAELGCLGRADENQPRAPEP